MGSRERQHRSVARACIYQKCRQKTSSSYRPTGFYTSRAQHSFSRKIYKSCIHKHPEVDRIWSILMDCSKIILYLLQDGCMYVLMYIIYICIYIYEGRPGKRAQERVP